MLLLLFLISSLIFAIELAKVIHIIRKGKSIGRTDHKAKRLSYMLKSALFQGRIRERWWGKLHIVIFYTFLDGFSQKKGNHLVALFILEYVLLFFFFSQERISIIGCRNKGFFNATSTNPTN